MSAAIAEGLTCELCGRVASFTDSIPDANVPGVTRSECGYRMQHLCFIHGVNRKRVHTSRVEPLNRVKTCGTCGKTWEDNYPDEPGAVLWCGDCERMRETP